MSSRRVSATSSSSFVESVRVRLTQTHHSFYLPFASNKTEVAVVVAAAVAAAATEVVVAEAVVDTTVAMVAVEEATEGM